MRRFIRLSTLSAVLAVVAVAGAEAGGMGDPSTHMKEQNAICDKQRRGELPPNPNMCLPELPVTPVYQNRSRG
jgi:hypothetical protein